MRAPHPRARHRPRPGRVPARPVVATHARSPPQLTLHAPLRSLAFAHFHELRVAQLSWSVHDRRGRFEFLLAILPALPLALV